MFPSQNRREIKYRMRFLSLDDDYNIQNLTKLRPSPINTA